MQIGIVGDALGGVDESPREDSLGMNGLAGAADPPPDRVESPTQQGPVRRQTELGRSPERVQSVA